MEEIDGISCWHDKYNIPIKIYQLIIQLIIS